MASRSLTKVISTGLRQKSAVTVGTAAPVRNNLWGWVRESFAGAWQNGVSIDPVADVVAFSPVFACVNRIATDVAKLPINLMELQNDGTWQLAVSTSPYWKTLRTPNGYQNRIQFVLMWLVSKLMYGNAYALKQRDARGVVNAMMLLDPRRVLPLVTLTGEVYYSIGADDLAQVASTGIVVPASEVIHDRGLTLFHPLVGVSPIYACGMSATQGRRIQNHGTKFFENMSRPSGMLTAPSVIDDETAARMKREFETNFGGSNIGRLFVAGMGLEYQPMTMPAAEAQLVEQLNWTVADCARAFGGIPLYKLNAGPIPTNNTGEELQQQYYEDCLQMPIESMELCWSEGLGLPSNYRIEVDVDALWRMDTGAQFEAFGKAVNGGWMAPNEARLKRNLRPLAGGDTCYLQQQMFSLEALSKRDALPDPFAKSGAPAPAPAAPAPPAPAPPAKQLTDEVITARAIEETADALDMIIRGLDVESA